MGFINEAQQVFNAVVGGSAATLVIWRVLLPHMRKALVGSMEPTIAKVDEIHQKTTINHHSSKEPTILDMLDDVKEQNRQVRRLLEEHIEDGRQHIERLDALESQQQNAAAQPSIMIQLPKLPFSK